MVNIPSHFFKENVLFFIESIWNNQNPVTGQTVLLDTRIKVEADV
jgi:hypothetical protein